MTRIPRWVAAPVVMAAAAAAIGATQPAQAASDYRWWSYWHVTAGSGAWTYAGTGPAGYRVDDGAVEGWRFVVASPNPSAPTPRLTASTAFESLCGDTDRPDGKDRIALVVDFGTSGDAPPSQTPPGGLRGSCVVVDDRSTGLEVLAQAGYAPRRDSSGLVCGLSGYPANECGVVVRDTTPKATPAPEPKPSKQPQTPSASADPGSPETGSSPSPAGPGATRSGPSARGELDPSASASEPATVPFTEESPTPEEAPALAIGPPPPPAQGPGAGTPTGLLVGLALVGTLGGAAALRGRSRTRQP